MSLSWVYRRSFKGILCPSDGLPAQNYLSNANVRILRGFSSLTGGQVRPERLEGRRNRACASGCATCCTQDARYGTGSVIRIVLDQGKRPTMCHGLVQTIPAQLKLWTSDTERPCNPSIGQEGAR